MIGSCFRQFSNQGSCVETGLVAIELAFDGDGAVVGQSVLAVLRTGVGSPDGRSDQLG